jgi:hypothetical protein
MLLHLSTAKSNKEVKANFYSADGYIQREPVLKVELINIIKIKKSFSSCKYALVFLNCQQWKSRDLIREHQVCLKPQHHSFELSKNHHETLHKAKEFKALYQFSRGHFLKAPLGQTF